MKITVNGLVELDAFIHKIVYAFFGPSLLAATCLYLTTYLVEFNRISNTAFSMPDEESAMIIKALNLPLFQPIFK